MNVRPKTKADLAAAVNAATLDVLFGASKRSAADKHGVSDEAIRASLKYANATQGVYALRCPITLKVRYVGSSTKIERRFVSHRSASGTTGNRCLWREWVMGLRQHKMEPLLEILAVVDDIADIPALERKWLDHFRALGQSDLNVVRNVGDHALSATKIKVLEKQVESLRKQVAHLKQQLSAKD